MAQFSLPGDLGTYVRTTPYEQRKQLYSSYSLGNVLGDFTGTAQQNQALYNYVQKQPTQTPTTQPAPTATPTAPLATPTTQTAPTSQYTRYAGSPDVFDASGRYISYDEALKNNLFQPGMIQDSPTSRPEVQQEQDYQSYSQQNLQGYQQPQQQQGGYSEESQFADFGQQALQLQEALGGTMNASDILSAAENSSDVIMARSRAETLRTRNDEALQRTLAKLGYKAGIDSADIEAKAMQLKDQLFSQLERSGLFQSGFKDKGVEGIEGFRKSGLEKVKQGLSMAEIEEQARALADREDIDYTLAKTIVQAADAEFKARMKEYEARQNAFNDFLKSQGLAMNPLTGEIFGTAAEKRAQEAQLRADAQLQLAMNRDLRADEQLKISQQRLELAEQAASRATTRVSSGRKSQPGSSDYIDDYAIRYSSGEIKAGSIPQNIRGAVFAKAKEFASVDLQNDVQQARSADDYGTREQLIDQLIGAYPEFTRDEIARFVYTGIPDKVSSPQAQETQREAQDEQTTKEVSDFLFGNVAKTSFNKF